MINGNFYSDTYINFMNMVRRQKNTINEDRTTYQEKFATKEQKSRDEVITSILHNYHKNYNNKIKYNKKHKERIIELCFTLIEITFLIFIASIVLILFCENLRNSIQGIASLLTVCVSLLGLIIGVFKIVTRYIFPEKEEEYITQIVSAIQENDYNTKTAYMNYHKDNTVTFNHSHDSHKI